MKFLDTTFLVDYERGEDDVAAYLESNEDDQFCTSTLCIKELSVGRHLVGEPTEADLLAPYGWVEVVPFGTSHAALAGEMEAALHEDDAVNRDRINAVTGDLLIAATARDLDATVVTANADGFAPFDVPVETY